MPVSATATVGDKRLPPATIAPDGNVKIILDLEVDYPQLCIFRFYNRLILILLFVWFWFDGICIIEFFCFVNNSGGTYQIGRRAVIVSTDKINVDEHMPYYLFCPWHLPCRAQFAQPHPQEDFPWALSFFIWRIIKATIAKRMIRVMIVPILLIIQVIEKSSL